MATLPFDVSQLPGTTGDRLAFAGRTVFATIAKLWHAIQNRRSVKYLLDWDDRMLNDIGLTRSDVLAAMSGPVSEDPSHRLSVLSVERRAAIRATARERLELASDGKVTAFRRPDRDRIKVLEI